MYDLLGNDIEDENAAPALPPKVVTKKATTSKKADAAPASADPAKARKNKKAPTGNEGALRSKANNKDVDAPASTPTKHTKKAFDRHSRTAKVDSPKKFKQGWGNDETRQYEGEVEGAQDAEAELEGEAAEEEAEPTVPQKSLQEYLAEQQAKQQELEGAKKLRQANEGAEDKWTAEEKIEKQQEAYFASTAAKKTKAKAHKEKVFLDVEAHFADEQPAFNSNRGGARGESRGGARGGSRGGFRGSRGGARGGSRGGRGGARGGRGKETSPKPALTEQNFPSL